MKLLREPLFHFLIAGALLFAAYTWLNRGTDEAAGSAARTVHITANEVEWLKQTWARQWQRPPSGSELKGLVAANLDRYQIVKGWLDKDGKLHEKVYDVAWSGNRKPDPKTGKLPPIGNTVDVANATWTNTIGSPELIAVWKDPAFDPKQRAFYYGRVLEIPTPRWTAYDAKYYGVQMPKEVPMVIQERAYTSPIWYAPVLSRVEGPAK